MSRRPLRALVALLLLGVLAAVAFGASGGIASSQHRTIPADKISDCLQDLKAQKQALAHLKELMSRKGQNAIIVVTDRLGYATYLSVRQATDFFTLQYVGNELTSAEYKASLAFVGKKVVESRRYLRRLLGHLERAVNRTQQRCNALRGQTTTTTTTPKPPPPSATTFTLQPALTKVTNTHAPELKIDAEGMSAVENHCCDGGGWKIDYSWDVPQTITPGKSIQIRIGITFESVNPSQPLGAQINALAPDFVQAVQAHWPDTPAASKTYTVPIAADQKDSSDIAITIGFVSSGVVYHYRK